MRGLRSSGFLFVGRPLVACEWVSLNLNEHKLKARIECMELGHPTAGKLRERSAHEMSEMSDPLGFSIVSVKTA